jgi:hypothetical protein
MVLVFLEPILRKPVFLKPNSTKRTLIKAGTPKIMKDRELDAKNGIITEALPRNFAWRWPVSVGVD